MSDAPWWQGATIYQIYPRSFLDTTGNGVGDLRGIAEKLDYVASLGVDAIWISPFVQSPMKDFGYDVSDYRAVDPLFGTEQDFLAVLDAAHARGIRVLMDQVLSHSSDRHPWFLESRASRDNPKADWYVWADPDETGLPPSNWLSVFGGPSWQWEPRRAQYYLHNFLREQPDLNYHNPEVQDAMLDVCRHWLDLGVDGFRLDVCAFYFHDAAFRDNPPDPNPPRGEHFLFNPYSFQRHVFDIGQPENLAFLERLRALTDSYDDRVLLGELHQENGIQLHRDYTAAGRLHLAYGYWLLGAEAITAGMVRDLAGALGHGDGDGWPCWALDNHDFKRSVSRCGWQQAHDQGEAALIHLAALTCLRGASCIYQGSELALPEAEVPHHRLHDPYGIEFWPAYKGRDGARTPMPWTGAKPWGDFSTVEPWLPVPDAHLDLSVARQEALPGSVLRRVRTFLHWRREIAPLRRGDMTFLDTEEPVLAFTRRLGAQTIVCAFNLGSDLACLTAPEALESRPASGHGFAAERTGAGIQLPGHNAYFGWLA